MNGKQGDHPITDVIHHQAIVYGEPIDGQLRQLCDFMSYQRLCEWFEKRWSLSREEFQPLVDAKLEECKLDARERGWE